MVRGGTVGKRPRFTSCFLTNKNRAILASVTIFFLILVEASTPSAVLSQHKTENWTAKLKYEVMWSFNTRGLQRWKEPWSLWPDKTVLGKGTGTFKKYLAGDWMNHMYFTIYHGLNNLNNQINNRRVLTVVPVENVFSIHKNFHCCSFKEKYPTALQSDAISKHLEEPQLLFSNCVAPLASCSV